MYLSILAHIAKAKSRGSQVEEKVKVKTAAETSNPENKMKETDNNHSELRENDNTEAGDEDMEVCADCQNNFPDLPALSEHWISQHKEQIKKINKSGKSIVKKLTTAEIDSANDKNEVDEKEKDNPETKTLQENHRQVEDNDDISTDNAIDDTNENLTNHKNENSEENRMETKEELMIKKKQFKKISKKL